MPSNENILRGAFEMQATAAAAKPGSPAPKLSPSQQSEYDKMIKKGMTPKQAHSFVKNMK